MQKFAKKSIKKLHCAISSRIKQTSEMFFWNLPPSDQVLTVDPGNDLEAVVDVEVDCWAMMIIGIMMTT